MIECWKSQGCNMTYIYYKFIFPLKVKIRAIKYFIKFLFMAYSRTMKNKLRKKNGGGKKC